jgi:hypothetical protein
MSVGDDYMTHGDMQTEQTRLAKRAERFFEERDLPVPNASIDTPREFHMKFAAAYFRAIGEMAEALEAAKVK